MPFAVLNHMKGPNGEPPDPKYNLKLLGWTFVIAVVLAILQAIIDWL